MNYFEESLKIMEEEYSHDVVMQLATVNDGKANIRTVNAYYKDRAFYITTYALSNKMREIAMNPNVAINHNLVKKSVEVNLRFLILSFVL